MVLRIEAKWEIPYVHSAGEHATKFFEALKEKRILVLKPPSGRTYPSVI